MSNNFTPFGPCEATIIESTGENVADQILSLSSLMDSNAGTDRKSNEAYIKLGLNVKYNKRLVG